MHELPKELGAPFHPLASLLLHSLGWRNTQAEYIMYSYESVQRCGEFISELGISGSQFLCGKTSPGLHICVPL